MNPSSSRRKRKIGAVPKFLKEVTSRIDEQLGTTPQELAARFDKEQAAEQDLNTLKQKRESLAQSRHAIGPVNLRAEQETAELEKDLGGVMAEREDLMQAVEELRAAIDKLNDEARERLLGAFDRVNYHFKDIFTRLFDGGKAHLSLLETDDPMESGLEIFAQPPGKTLQSLSLLSGGEQTLTALALIFAMFMTNPAPICVLDEVDAPLDDANVDRFCDLLEEFAEKGETRFLIITHHRLTMARMDRLYGVTMGEQGVSQLVSVDINQQLDFLEAA
jgi:chromosome segregation protein